MANPFLLGADPDIKTAQILERAYVLDIGKAPAYTNEKGEIFINTEDNLAELFPNYNQGFLKWLLWHEKMHNELKHAKRYFRYLDEKHKADIDGRFAISKEEVNIIMDILVHDSMSRMFPELVDTAIENLAQMRNRNSLEYTFTTNTLEEMLEEYKKEVDPDSEHEGRGEGEESEETEEGEGEGIGEKESDDKTEREGEDKPKEDTTSSDKKGHSESSGEDKKPKSTPKDEGEVEDTSTPTTPPPEHDKTDWSKLKDIDSKEFIDTYESDRYKETIERLKRKKIQLGNLTSTLNGLATTTKKRTYAVPSTIRIDDRTIMKGRKPGRAKLYLVFDASGSMGSELATFKEIIAKAIPQAMDTPCEWFSGNTKTGRESISRLKNTSGKGHDYYKGKFKDIMPVYASSGYDDDGDRTIELCYKAEQLGYSPIGVTDGGGSLSWSKNMLKDLKRTILVTPSDNWTRKVKEVNPEIQVLKIDRDW